MEVFITIFTLISLCIIISAYFNPITRKIGFRNIRRRIGNTFLVMLGSMVGSALIAGSLVLSDSLDKTFYNLVDDQLAEVDLLINMKQKTQTGSPIAYAGSDEKPQIENALKSEKIDGILFTDFFQISPVKVDQENKPVVNMYQVALYGLDIESYNQFGGVMEKKLDPFESDNSIFITEYIAKRLELEEGDKVVIPFAERQVETIVQKVYPRGYIPSDPVIVIDRSYLNSIIGIPQDGYNTVFVSAKGGIEPDDYDGKEFQKLVEEKMEIVQSDEVDFVYYESKQQALDGFGMKTFSDVFLVMSFFGIFAGILLIVNLYMMLASERKYEMGILRAIALTRTQLMQAFVYEGYLYSIASSLLGAFVGVGIGYFIVRALNQMFGEIFALMGQEDIFNIVFDAKIDSIVIAFCFGAIITIITATLASYKISKLNIVSAIRDMDEITIPKKGIKWMITTIMIAILTFVGVSTLGSYFTVENALVNMRDQGNAAFAELSDRQFSEIVNVAKAYSLYVGVVFTLIFGTFFVNRLIHAITKKDISRITVSLSSLAIIIFTALLSKVDAFIEAGQSQSSIGLFFMSGIILVIAASLVIIYNIDFLVRAATFVFAPFKGLVPVMKISLRYPSVNKARTGLTVIMFAVVIFLIVYTSMMKVTIRQINDKALNETLGGYDVLVIPMYDRGLGELGQIQSKINNNNDVQISTEIVHTNVIMPEYKYKDLDESPYYDNPYMNLYKDEDFFATSFDGLPVEYIKNKNIELEQRLDRYNSDEEAWSDVINDPSKVILGVAFSQMGYGKKPDLKLGQKVQIADIFNKEAKEYEVIGFTRMQGGGVGVNADFNPNIITTNTAVTDRFERVYVDQFSSAEILVGFNDSRSVIDQNRDLKKDLIEFDIAQIFELSELTQTAQSFMDSFILLFQAFLGFSLVVGASGLAIIVARSVNERRQQIGMLRSLGFQKSMILTGFFVEATFITFIGIVIGVSMGTIGALNEFYVAFHDQPDIKPVFAYKEVFIIALIVYLASIVFSISPAIKASRLSPVEATNYPE